MEIMESYLSATRAARHFSDLLNRVVYRGETFVVERGGQPICRIAPIGPPKCTPAGLAELLRSIPKPDPEYWNDLEEITKHQPLVPESSWSR
jgi:antitoxin (DNA-binding transcriptional repressor) of toxin-antitoxin stability system